ncbi:hypothetical protein [Gottfriedia acidiceleris]
MNLKYAPLFESFMTPFILNGVSNITDEQLAQNAAEYVKYVTKKSVTV